jgi:S-formylglutathione hydrolase FrmB
MMKRLLIAFALVIAVSTAKAQWPGFGKIEFKTMPSQILKEDREYAIYLPKTYSTEKDKTYPVLYLLHGGGGSHTDWPKKANLTEVANVLIDANDACDMIIVCPEAGKTFMNYFNNPDWMYEDYFFKELIPHIESTYRVKAEKKSRAIAGLSMGGGGTVVYASHHPEMFIAAYTMSGYLKRQDELFWINWDDPTTKKVHQLVEDNNCTNYLKNADKEKIKAMKTVNWFIDCGDDDFTFNPNIDYVMAMKEAGIPYQLRIRDGGHNWEYWHSALYIALPYISNYFRE